MDQILIKRETNTLEKFQFKGLCVNCDHRYNCKIRDKTRVVINCEEYQ